MSDTLYKSDLVDIACQIRETRDMSVAVADGSLQEDGKYAGREKWFWLPMSQIEINDNGTVTMPEWLAAEKGLL